MENGMKKSLKSSWMIVISLLTLIFSALGVTPAHATGIVSYCDETSLLGAISGGGTITFRCSGTITLTGTIHILQDITLDGAGQNVTISGGNAVSVFYIPIGNGLTLKNITVANGYVGPGMAGGGFQNLGRLKIENSTISNNQADMGGGIAATGSSVTTVTNSTFSGNRTNNKSPNSIGGAIFSLGTVTITNSIFLNNTAASSGGAIGSWGSTNISNSTFSNNYADEVSGAIFANGPLTVTNSTFTGNSAGTSAGGLGAYGGSSVTVSNSIFSGNTPGGNCSGTIQDGGGNLIWGDTSCPGANIDPLLGALGNYGGSTQTFPLLPGSPAINATSANCPVTDQRGIARGITCDSGAFESQGFTLTKAGGDNQSTLIGTVFVNPLTLSVSSAYGEPVDGGAVTFLSPVSGAGTSFSPNPATISAGAVSVSATANGSAGGPYSVTVSAAGAPNVSFTLKNLEAAVISFDPAPTPIFGGADFSVNAVTTNSDDPTLTYSVDSGPCALVSAATFHSSGAGTCVVRASGPVTANFGAASQTQSVMIAKAEQATLTIVNPSPLVYGRTVRLTTTGGSGTGAVTYSKGVSTGCAITDDSLSVTNVSGTCVITAAKATDSNYNVSTSAGLTILLQKAMPVISFGPAPSPQYPDANFSVSATTSNTDDSTLTYHVVSGPCALVSVATFSSSGIGVCKVQAVGVATTNFTSATQTQTVTITARVTSRISGNVGVKGASLRYTGGSSPVIAATDGSYTITVPNGWNGTITPSKASYVFTPASRSYTNVQNHKPGQNFTAQLVKPAIPTTISPTGTIINTSPTYTWNASAEAASYRLSVYNQTTSSYVINGMPVPATACTGTPSICRFHPATVLGTYTYKFSVAAVNAAGNSGFAPFASWRLFKVSKLVTYEFVSAAAQDGYLLESAEASGIAGVLNSTTAIIYVGDDAKKRQFRSILSFDTTGLPDNAVIVSATLKLKKQAGAGVDPFSTLGALTIDIKSSNFGASPLLQLDDFAAAAGLSNAGVVGKTPVNGLYVANLVGPSFKQINKTGLTQLRLRFAKDNDNDAVADWLAFCSGDAPAATDRPVLAISYYVP
jgi:hypothetical protein